MDPTGLSTGVDENTGTIISASDDGDCGVYLYPTVDGERVEGPCFLMGLTGTPGCFASFSSVGSDVFISYIGLNIGDFGSGFTYGDFCFSSPKQEMIGYASPNIFETIGDAASFASIGLNVASIGCVYVGAYPAAGTCSSAAAVMDSVAFFSYLFAGCSEKAGWAFASVGLDLVPFIAPNLKAAYNPVAERFINDTTKRFIPTIVGKAKYYSFPAIGVGLGVGSNLFGEIK